MGHGDDLNRLAKKFEPPHRYANFGPSLRSMEVQGFRGVDQLRLDFNSPITALCGLNGTGKSTLAQLAACAYRKLSTGSGRRYYVKTYFPVSAADPTPFRDDASVLYAYEMQEELEPQRVTVRRAKKEWGGYKRQPERACYYLGFTQFIPKVERRDFSIYGGHLIRLGQSRDLDQAVTGRIMAILGLPYEKLGFTEISHSSRSAELAMATRNSRRYSENHMGFGEGRVVYMVSVMETAPTQSLFVLEEPETSLHGEAQEKLAQYIVDVCFRRGHQVVLTTHSAAILSQLGPNSIAYLRRKPSEGVIEVTPGLATYQIDSYLRGDRAPGDRVVCVEDDFARQFLTAILRRCDRDMVAGLRFVCAGSHQQLRQAVAIIRESGMKAAGLTDGDTADSGNNGILALPGSDAPERVVFADDHVRAFFATMYEIDLAEVLAAVPDHHRYASTIASRVAVDEAVIATQACDAYVADRLAIEFDPVLAFLRRELI